MATARLLMPSKCQNPRQKVANTPVLNSAKLFKSPRTLPSVSLPSHCILAPSDLTLAK